MGPDDADEKTAGSLEPAVFIGLPGEPRPSGGGQNETWVRIRKMPGSSETPARSLSTLT